MSDGGFFLMHRGWRDNPVFRGEFSRSDAWVWLIENACWKPTRFDINGKTVTIERGQLTASVRYLADVWGWSKSAVDRFFTRLETETMIERKAGHGRLVITICNYAKYQDKADDDRDTSGTPTGTRAGHERDIKEQGNKGTREQEEEKKARGRAFGFPCPENVDPIDWDALKANRKAKRAPLTEGAHRQIIRKLDGWKRDGWPPGPIVAFAAERGWTTVFETDEMKAGHGKQPHQTGKRNGIADALDREIGFGESARPPERRAIGGSGSYSLRAIAGPASG